MAKLYLPQRLMSLVAATGELTLQNGAFKSSMLAFVDKYPLLTPYFFDQNGGISHAISIFINDYAFSEEELNVYNLQSSDRVEILVNLAGG